MIRDILDKFIVEILENAGTDHGQEKVDDLDLDYATGEKLKQKYADQIVQHIVAVSGGTP